MGEARQDKPLYQTSFTLTEEEYERMSFAVMRRQFVAYTAVISGVLVIGALVSAIASNMLLVSFFLLIAVAFPFLLRWAYRRQLQKSYRSNRLIQNQTSQYQFFADRVEATDADGNHSTIPYDKLYRRIETPTHVYLLLGKNQAFAVRKEGAPSGLIPFLLALPANAKPDSHVDGDATSANSATGEAGTAARGREAQ